MPYPKKSTSHQTCEADFLIESFFGNFLYIFEYYIYSFAKEFDCENYIEYDNEFKEHFPTPQLDKYMRKKIYEYDNYVFYAKLLTKMANMDTTNNFNEDIDNFNFKNYLKINFLEIQKLVLPIIKNIC